MRNFYPLPFAPYNGTFSARPFHGVGGSLIVNAMVKWFTYDVAGQPLGTLNNEFNVNVDLNAAASNTVSLSWVIRSVYIDNADNNFPISVFFPSTSFAISCPANSSGWYQVFTFDRRAWICASQISDVDISNLATTNVFFTDGIVNSFLDQEQPTAVNMKLASPIISLGGGGGEILTINVIDPGQWTAGGTINISGAGGIGAGATGVRNAFGSFNAVDVTAPGNGFTGPPNVTYGGTFTVPPTWFNGINIPAGGMVSYGGYVYAANYGGAQTVEPPNLFYWTYTQHTSTPRAPVMQAVVSPIVGGASFSNASAYGPAALGDQVLTFIDQLSGAAPSVFRNNVFNTPYQSGFIYLTNIDVRVLASAAGTSWNWVLEDDLGNAILTFEYPTNAAARGVEQLLSLQGCNLKIPANRTYLLHTTGVSGTITLQHVFAWVYSSAFG